MKTGLNCPCCGLAILTNSTIVGFPILRITQLNSSALTGEEVVFHASCFIAKMQEKKEPKVKIITP
jgi:hypothetical protein